VNSAPQPSAVFFTVQGVFKVCPAAGQQSGIRLRPVLFQYFEETLFFFERTRALAALIQVIGKAAQFNCVKLIAYGEEHQQQLPSGAPILCRARTF
jgi:hypothetical protein